MADKVELKLSLKGDSDDLDKRIKELEDKGITVKIKSDDKELDKGGIKGMLKDTQEFAARMADGGISKGFAQLTQAGSNFAGSLKSGKSVSDSFSAGIHAVGLEGAAVGGIIAAVAIGAVKLGAALLQANIASEANFRVLEHLGGAYQTVRDQTLNLVTAQEALALKQAGLTSGLRLTDDQMGRLSEGAVRFAHATGTDTAQALQQLQAALHGDAGAARAFGVAIEDGASSTEILNATLTELANRQGQAGDLTRTTGEEFDQFGQNLSKIGSSILSLGGQVLGAVFGPILKAVSVTIEGAAKLFQFLDNGLRSLLGGNAIAQQRQEAERVGEAQVRAANLQEQARQRNIQAAQVELGIMLAQADQQGLGNNILGRRLGIHDNLLRLEAEYSSLQRRQGETAEGFIKRESELTRNLIEARRNDLTERNRTFDLRLQAGLLQQQISHAHINLGIGAAAITHTQAERQLRQEINRILTEAANQGRQLNDLEQQRVLQLGQQVVQQHEAAKSQGEQARQAALQLEQTLFQLRLQNELNGERKRDNTEALRSLDIGRELATVEDRITGFHGRRADLTQREADTLSRLLERARSLRDAQVELLNIRANGIPVDSLTASLIERATAGMQAQLDVETQLDQAREREYEQTKALLQSQRDYLGLQGQSAVAALQAAFAGSQLTSAQQSAYNNIGNIVGELNTEYNTNAQRLGEINSQLSSGVVSDQERLNLQQERNGLLQYQIGLEQQIKDIQLQQNGPDFNTQMSQSVRGLAGEYRSLSAVWGGIGTQALTQFTGAFKQHLAAVINGKESVIQALLAVLNETLTSIATESLIKGIFNLAEGAASQASTYGIPNPKSIQHFAAAGTYLTVAAVAGAGAIASGIGLAAVSNSSGASAGGGSAGASSNPSSIGRQGVGDDTKSTQTIININGPIFNKEQFDDYIAEANRSSNRRNGISLR